MSDQQLPTAHIELYLDCWETFGTAEFSPERCRATLTPPADDGRSDWERGDVERVAETLVAAGLLDRTAERRYQVRLTPDDDLDDWIDHCVSRTASLHEAVQSALGNRDSPASESTGADVVDFEGATYLRIPVTPETTVGDLASALSDTFDANPDHEHVVLTAPADEAAHVQHLADSLCGSDADQLESASLQKVTTQVLGADPDTLTFRLFLTRSDSYPG
ncbi:hypothetical protein [Halorientalis sp. IM1011]|uniref:hypothetical protein n=1 Tax=Halorientalis sp. IM1011 TaxID=1932360 RepID=UPI0012FC319F|nr:hypothetical protein [Halorientalis sp. IM1011]